MDHQRLVGLAGQSAGFFLSLAACFNRTESLFFPRHNEQQHTNNQDGVHPISIFQNNKNNRNAFGLKRNTFVLKTPPNTNTQTNTQMVSTLVIMACLLALPEKRNPPQAVWVQTVNKTGFPDR
ncbi:MAG: hypothetical protein K0U11_06825 [Gammaproteobacteria bacterium]|nr:hypothetical protein [Gammaproteobacteria bacterium]